jgi:hypothetical protein
MNRHAAGAGFFTSSRKTGRVVDLFLSNDRELPY